MKKSLLILAAALCLIGALCIPKAAPAEAEQEPAEWTVLFYLCGSDLESRYGYATENLKEIATCHYPRTEITEVFGGIENVPEILRNVTPERINVLIETGGCKEWHAQELGLDISNSALQRWRYECYTNDDIPDGFYLEDTLPLQSMADPATLADFIRWGAEKYPAEKYALILWDHGGGSKTGLFIDELFGEDIMNLAELKQAMEDGGVYMEAVLFDACMMANLETAYAIADYADWMIASEEVVAGQGTAVGDWLQQMYIDPEFNGEWLGRWVCDMTQIKYANENNEQAQQLLTWSVIDLSRIPRLVQMFDLAMKQFGEVYTRSPQIMSYYMKYMAQVEHYGDENGNMWDLTSIFYMPEMSSMMSMEAHRKLLNALKDTVVYCLRGPGRSSARGLSYCYAVNFDKEELDEYAVNCPSAHYLAFLDAISPWTAPDWVYETAERLPEMDSIPEYQVVAKKVILEDGTPAVTFGDECYLGASSVRYNVFTRSKKTGQIVSLGTMPAFFDDSVGDHGVFQAVEPWYWPALEGQHIASFVIGLVSPGANAYLGSVPIRIGTDKWFLRYGYFLDEKRYVVYGLWDGYETDSGQFNRNVKSLSQLAGQEYSLLYPVYITDYEASNQFETAAPQTILRSMRIEDKAVAPGTYYIQYVVYDMFMRPMPMEWIEIQWDGQKPKLPDDFTWEGEEILRVAEDYWE